MNQIDPRVLQALLAQGQGPQPNPAVAAALNAPTPQAAPQGVEMAQSFFGPDGTMMPQQPDGMGTQVAPKPWQRRLNSLQANIPEYQAQAEAYPDEPFGAEVQDMQRQREQILDRYAPQGFERADRGTSLPPVPQGREAEFGDMGADDRLRVLRALQGGAGEDEAFAPGGYDPRDMIGGGGGVMDIDGQQGGDELLPYGDEKLTGEQSKAVTYLRRGMFSNQTLNDPKMEQALTQFTDRFAGNFGGIGRLVQDEDFQVADRAAREFLAVILRKDTGAAITNEEFRMYGPMYLPLPGDKPAVIEAKRKARDEALIAIEMGLGSAAPLANMMRQELAPAPDLGALSDDDLMKMLTGG